MRKVAVSVVAGIVLLGVVLVVSAQSGKSAALGADEVPGRYQLTWVIDGGGVLLDTASGRTWVLNNTFDDNPYWVAVAETKPEKR